MFTIYLETLGPSIYKCSPDLVCNLSTECIHHNWVFFLSIISGTVWFYSFGEMILGYWRTLHSSYKVHQKTACLRKEVRNILSEAVQHKADHGNITENTDVILLS